MEGEQMKRYIKPQIEIHETGILTNILDQYHSDDYADSNRGQFIDEGLDDSFPRYDNNNLWDE